MSTSFGGLRFGDLRRLALDIEVVTHGQSSDPFWSIFVNGTKQAAADTGATVNYNAPSGTTFDINLQAPGTYKLANIAESVGTVTQDRLAGIAGEIGHVTVASL